MADLERGISDHERQLEESDTDGGLMVHGLGLWQRYFKVLTRYIYIPPPSLFSKPRVPVTLHPAGKRDRFVLWDAK